MKWIIYWNCENDHENHCEFVDEEIECSCETVSNDCEECADAYFEQIAGDPMWITENPCSQCGDCLKQECYWEPIPF